MAMNTDWEESRCFTCSRTGDECTWVNDFTPVKGWKAKVGKSPYGSKGNVTNVRECPNYKKIKVKSRWTHLKKQYGN